MPLPNICVACSKAGTPELPVDPTGLHENCRQTARNLNISINTLKLLLERRERHNQPVLPLD